MRRELARNFVWYLPDTYDGWDALPVWAQETLSAHEADPRPALYTISQLERGETSDSYWNAAQWQMVVTGHMHNYMRHGCGCCAKCSIFHTPTSLLDVPLPPLPRFHETQRHFDTCRMYWCKRLLEWTPSARTAMEWATHLNDKYELDGRDENGYMGIAWCFGLHDRPFPEKAIYGTVRSMSHAGLARKFDMGRYESLVKSLCLKVRSPALLALLPKQARTGIKAFFAFWGNGAASLKKWILQAAAQG